MGNGRIKVYNAVDVIEDDDSDCFYKENGVMYFDTTCLREIAEISLDGLRLRCPQWFMGDYKALFRLGQCPINRARSLRASYLAPRLGPPRCSIMPIATNLITVGWA
ncbi:hypothetical protein [Vulcanisaeta distributa]|uniref:hypothetical protein n=1 Tax=Vulcanisaeta distributa TaxID=164451 RepID=UPI0006D15218|nr:hypothetical protein [Vulcanisaeta distributa]